MGRDAYTPLFEIKEARCRIAHRIYAVSMFVGICMMWAYRATQIPIKGRWAWFCMFGAEIWFGVYWTFTQAARWRPIYRYTFKERLRQRYGDELPGVDVFVCTADPLMEPPVLVMNTVLSVMAYDYPSDKLSVYLSDDGGSDLTFYAILEASRFSAHWIPFCKKYEVEPRAPEVYFNTSSEPHDAAHAKEWRSIQTLYEEMVNRIDSTVKLGQVPDEIRAQHKGFFEWNSVVNSRNHQTILQIVIDGRDPNSVDMEGTVMPTLVYMAREKRPQYNHNFKAGALNALIRLSSIISNGPIILIVDCDMYSNNAKSVRDALCFFMDEERGHEIAFVQYPQKFYNITKNDIYSSTLRGHLQVEFHGMDGFGGPMCIGTGCFLRRESLCGIKYTKEYEGEWKKGAEERVEKNVIELEERAKCLANCNFEENSMWGKEVGFKYGNPVEDVETGLAIQCNGWKSVYFNPRKEGFMGIAPTTLEQTLVQHKRWTEGDLQIFLSKQCPFIQGYGKIKLPLQLSYGVYLSWALNAIPTLFYVLLPSLCLLNAISLFPRISSPWIAPFGYVAAARLTYSICEWLWVGGSLQSWWHEQRIALFKRMTSYFFATIDVSLKLTGLGKAAFAITAKATNDDEASSRYEQEIMEFGSATPMFMILATVAMVNLFCFVGAIKRLAVGNEIGDIEALLWQLVLCGLLVIVNWPVYEGLFLRKDRGRLPNSVAYTSTGLALLAFLISMH